MRWLPIEPSGLECSIVRDYPTHEIIARGQRVNAFRPLDLRLRGAGNARRLPRLIPFLELRTGEFEHWLGSSPE